MAHNALQIVPSLMLGELKQLKYIALRGNPLLHHPQERLLDSNALLNVMRGLHATTGLSVVVCLSVCFFVVFDLISLFRCYCVAQRNVAATDSCAVAWQR